MQKDKSIRHDFFKSPDLVMQKEKVNYKSISLDILKKLYNGFKNACFTTVEIVKILLTLGAVVGVVLGLPFLFITSLMQDAKYDRVEKIIHYGNISKESFEFNMKALNSYSLNNGYSVNYEKNSNTLSVKLTANKNLCKNVARKIFYGDRNNLQNLIINDMVITKEVKIDNHKNDVLCSLEENSIQLNLNAIK